MLQQVFDVEMMDMEFLRLQEHLHLETTIIHPQALNPLLALGTDLFQLQNT